MPDWVVLLLDGLFVILFVVVGIHGRRLVAKEAPLWDYAGYAASWLLALGWAFFRLEAGILVPLLVLLAGVASAMPMVRGVQRAIAERGAA